MDATRRPEVLYEAEHSHRLVDSALTRFEGARDATASGRPSGLESLAHTLIVASQQIASLQQQLQQSRGILERASVERLGQMQNRLSQVSSATEVATTGMLDGLERALTTLDSLAFGDGTTPEAQETVRTSVRDQLYDVMAHLQFQDITSQQMGYASAVITETEQRLAALSATLASFAPEIATVSVQDTVQALAGHCDPHATVESKVEQQAFADRAFARA
jgi:chemotaxis regulatin CheY-phosphate phosphatase CheZ